MTEIAVYGLPVRMPHWSFGVRYIHQLVRQSMGHSKIFEVMFPGDPCRAFLMDAQLARREHAGHRARPRPRRLLEEQPAVRALPRAWRAATSSSRRRRTRTASSRRSTSVGLERVEAVLDAALALESHVDVDRRAAPRALSGVRRRRRTAPSKRDFQQALPHPAGRVRAAGAARLGPLRARVPPHPEYDLLWFIANYAPELEQWERDIFLAVRAESLYFYPVFACQIMNEGWASYWHARLLREADFLPQPTLPRGDQGAFRRGAAVRLGRADRARHQPLPPRLHASGSTSSRSTASTSAREVMARGGRLRLHPQLARRASWPRSSTCSSTRRGRATRSASPAATWTRCARRSSRPSSTSARRASPRPSCKSDGSLVLAHDHASDGRGLDAARAQQGAGVRAARLAPPGAAAHRQRARRAGRTRCLGKG